MAKRTIDLDDYQPPSYEDYDGDDPRPGWYTFELVDVFWYDQDAEKLQWVFKIAEEPFQGWPGMMFGDFGNTKWINQQIAVAIQGAEKPLTVDFDSEAQVKALIKKAKRVRGKVELRTNKETQEQRLTLRRVRPLLEDASKTATRSRAKDEDLTPQQEPEADAAEGDDAPYTEDELAEMSLDDLKGILSEELELVAPAKGRREKEDDYVNKLIDLILAAQEAEEGEGNSDDFGEGAEAFQEPEPEPEPEPATTTRRRRGATAPAKETAAPATTTRRRRSTS